MGTDQPGDEPDTATGGGGSTSTCLDEIRELGVTRGHDPMDVRLHLCPFIICVCPVVLGKAGLALAILEQKKLNHAAKSIGRASAGVSLRKSGLEKLVASLLPRATCERL